MWFINHDYRIVNQPEIIVYSSNTRKDLDQIDINSITNSQTPSNQFGPVDDQTGFPKKILVKRPKPKNGKKLLFKIFLIENMTTSRLIKNPVIPITQEKPSSLAIKHSRINHSKSIICIRILSNFNSSICDWHKRDDEE